MDQNVFRFIWRFSRREQIVILIATIISFPFLYYSLELPKIIVDEAIGGTGVTFPLSVFGASLGQIDYLLMLSGIFLGLVCINGAFKYYINVYRGLVGERMLRRLRFDLYHRVLRFRLPQFRRMSQGEIIPMITAEVEPVGGFAGDAFALPAFQGGTLLVYMVFIFIQDPVLGAAAIALYPVQAYIIPKLQWHVNQLGKRRVRAVRQLSDRIGETVSGTQEIHAHDTSRYHLADIGNRLGDIYDIRFEIYRRKFFIKFLNNFLNQLTPFFFFSIGGYFVIQGNISFGSLVAVLAAYKDLSGPWRELLNYYQRTEDVRIKYEQVVEQFQPPDIQPPEQLAGEPVVTGPLPTVLSVSNVGYVDDSGTQVLDGVTLTLDLTRTTAILARGGSGRSELMLVMARLLVPTAGRIRLGNHDLADLPEATTGRRFAYVGASSAMLTGTVRDNLYYTLRHAPTRPAAYDGDEVKWSERRVADARASGNSEEDIRADWIDYDGADVDGPEALERRALEVLEIVDLAADVYRFGLAGTIDPQAQGDVAERVLVARAEIRRRLEDPAYADLVELFDRDSYNDNATVAENVIFGTVVGDSFEEDGLADHPHIAHVLDAVGLTEDFLRMGLSVAETMIELFADLPPGHPFFEQYSFIAAEDLPEFQPLVAVAQKDGLDKLPADGRQRLLSLPFKLVPARHRLDLIDGPIRDRLLEARRVFMRDLPEAYRDTVEFFDADSYNTKASVQDNILFGKIRYGRSGTVDQIQRLTADVVDQVGLRGALMAVGLDVSVGVVGGRLTPTQRQKLALARALLKRPDILFLDDATSTLDPAVQQRVHRAIFESMDGKALIWAPHRPELARGCAHLVLLEGGRVLAQGQFEELEQRGLLEPLLES